MDRAWRLLDDGAGEPAFNMAVDETLLERGRLQGAPPALRLYAWAPPAVSLGRFQGDEEIPLALRGYARVRRATGGGAILHRDEITFAVAAPLDALGGEGAGVETSFFAVNRAIARGLALLGVTVDEIPEERERAAAVAPAEERTNHTLSPFLCFARRSRTDLTVGGAKLVGSAQRRRHRWALQHGAIPLGLEEEVAAAPRPATLARGFEEAFGARLVPEPAEESEQRRGGACATAGASRG